MANLSPWLFFILALLPAVGLPLVMCGRGSTGGRFVAAQLATAVGLMVAIAATVAFSEPSSIDLALTLGMMSLPATLLYAVALERWL